MPRTASITAAAAAALAAAALFLPAANAGPPHTVLSTVRPVTGTGHVAGGFTRDDVAGSVDCDRGEASPVARSARILYCYPDADYAIACWKAAKSGYALCDNQPFKRAVTRYRAHFSGSWTAAPEHPVPFEFRLRNGVECSIRDGGAAGVAKQHPNRIPWYYCASKADNTVWAVPSSKSGGIDRAHPLWTVEVGTEAGTKIHRAAIAHAYYLGTR